MFYETECPMVYPNLNIRISYLIDKTGRNPVRQRAVRNIASPAQLKAYTVFGAVAVKTGRPSYVDAQLSCRSNLLQPADRIEPGVVIRSI